MTATTNLPATPLIDDLIGNYQGSTRRITIPALKDLLDDGSDVAIPTPAGTALDARKRLVVNQTGTGKELIARAIHEASALIEAIAARLAAMSEEERGAFQALIEEYFPLTKLTEEALEYDYVEFTLEIRVRLEDGYRMERYGFRQSEGVWTLTSIAVAGMDI